MRKKPATKQHPWEQAEIDASDGGKTRAFFSVSRRRNELTSEKVIQLLSHNYFCLTWERGALLYLSLILCPSKWINSCHEQGVQVVEGLKPLHNSQIKSPKDVIIQLKGWRPKSQMIFPPFWETVLLKFLKHLFSYFHLGVGRAL